MFVFMGLWSACDKQGVFPWKPKLLKLDIYPFLEFDMKETLGILLDNGFVEKFETADGKAWGFVPNFERHQRITGDEGKNPARYPSPDEATARQSRHTGDTLKTHPIHFGENGKRKGIKEREKEANSCGSPEPPFPESISENPEPPETAPIEREGASAAPMAAKTSPGTIRGDSAKTALVPARSRSPPKKPRKADMTPGQLALFRAARLCFESDEKAKALMYQDPASAAREMRHLKTLAARCYGIAPEMPAVFLQNILGHFRIMCNGKHKGKWVFTPQTLVTTWIWNLVIDSLPGPENPKLRELVRGMFD